ncbi:MAG: DUF3015 domain-containing protein [Candidatus Binatia bacterium]
MRKTVLLAATAVVLSSSAAWAGDPDIGCGWGTQAFKGQSGVLYKVIAGTTNGSFGNQTFGISSGTIGCSRGGVIKADAQLNMYAGANIDKLASDMAAGQGESLDTLAVLLGVEDADKPAFFQLTKSNFDVIFPSGQVTAGTMLSSLVDLMSADQQLSKYTS